MVCMAALDTAPPEKREFLVRNDRNDVEVLKCATPQMVGQGLLELGGLPHVCVAGESNSGKSSLINHLLKKNLAKASSVAGKTRSVDMMKVNEKLVLTDLPGLPSRDHQVAHMWDTVWEPLVFNYMRQCDQLRSMIYVHDIRWKVSPQVRSFVRDVQEEGVPVLVVMSKDDRLAAREADEPDAATMHELRLMHANRIRRSLAFEGVHVHYSTDSSLASSRNGRRTLLRHIEKLVAAGSREECASILHEMADRRKQ